MKRRSIAGDKASKARRHKVATQKRRNATKSARGGIFPVAGQETEIARLTRELHEAREQQAATSGVLGIISTSAGDLKPAFHGILANAIRICDATFGALFRHDNGAVEAVAQVGVPPALAEFLRQHGLSKPAIGTGLHRMLQTKKVVCISDELAGPVPSPAARLGGARSIINVPMLKENALIGAISIYRLEVRPFTDEQIKVVEDFASQAVIAIENARLLNELRESLDRQTATSEVLGVISASPGELQPVFDAMLKSATRLCDAECGILTLRRDDGFQAIAMQGVDPGFAEVMRRAPFRPTPDSMYAHLERTKQPLQFADGRQSPAYLAGNPTVVAAIEQGGVRTNFIVPMLKKGELVGAIWIYRKDVRPFSLKHIEVVENFGKQAVIAIENTRLLNELRERTEEVVKLNEQLEQRVADQVGEIERMGRLRRFLPPQVADLIVASGTEKQLESHRREITALFCDLRGFTGFSESSDPEDVMALLRDYHAAIGEIIIKYSGTLERYAGDGVMVVFNDPVPVEKPALQAVLMALEMRDVIGALTEKWRRLGHDIGFGIGIAHGFATLGTIGFEGRFDYAAIGTVSNVASRLCDEAKPSQILISPRVLMAVEDAVTTEPAGEFTLKGIRRPMAAHNVLAAAPPKS
jgi:class 3 adenylate cyclase